MSSSQNNIPPLSPRLQAAGVELAGARSYRDEIDALGEESVVMTALDAMLRDNMAGHVILGPEGRAARARDPSERFRLAAAALLLEELEEGSRTDDTFRAQQRNRPPLSAGAPAAPGSAPPNGLGSARSCRKPQNGSKPNPATSTQQGAF